MREKLRVFPFVRFIFKISIATLISVLSFVAAFLIRFEFNVNTPVFDVWFSAYTNNVVQLGTIAFLIFGVMEGVCEAKKLKASCGMLKIFVSTLLVEIATYAFMLGQIRRISRSIYIISFLLMFFLLLGKSVCVRFIAAKLVRLKHRKNAARSGLGENEGAEMGYLESLDKLPLATIKSRIEGRNIMVTGAAGKYATELVKQIAKFKVRRLILIDTNANALWSLAEYLRTVSDEIKVEVYVLDIRRNREMSDIFERYRPHIIFHLAGHRKYVENPENRREFISCNLIGTQKMLELASENLAERFVLVSNLNGEEAFVERLRKREADRVRLAQNESNTQFCVYEIALSCDDKDEIVRVAQRTFELFAKREEGTLLQQ